MYKTLLTVYAGVQQFRLSLDDEIPCQYDDVLSLFVTSCMPVSNYAYCDSCSLISFTVDLIPGCDMLCILSNTFCCNGFGMNVRGRPVDVSYVTFALSN